MTVSGRKHSIRLCSPRQAEAERWGVALREVIASKAPLETPTQLLLRDIQVPERGLHRERGGWWTQQLSGFMGAPFSITVTLPWPLGELWGPRSRGTHLPSEPHSEAHQWGLVCPTPAPALWSQRPR